jgi:hypothetical protein
VGDGWVSDEEVGRFLHSFEELSFEEEASKGASESFEEEASKGVLRKARKELSKSFEEEASKGVLRKARKELSKEVLQENFNRKFARALRDVACGR